MGGFIRQTFKGVTYGVIGMLLLCCMGCRKEASTHTAFYSWKTVFRLNKKETALLGATGTHHLYLRFFDVVWNEQVQQALPNGVLSIKTPPGKLNISPVVYVTNQSLEKSQLFQMDSLAIKVNQLLNRIAARERIPYASIQIDCDWTVGTRTKYFAFLQALKKCSHKKLEATIRLHQVKYPERTGVPPVDKGVLMFYNMGKISAAINARNSIYNPQDAAAYIAALPNYHLPLDVALPLFSWTIQIRAGKVLQLYAKITQANLSNSEHFLALTKTEEDKSTPLATVGGSGASTSATTAIDTTTTTTTTTIDPAPLITPCVTYRARQSFYLKGVYVKKGDLFKFEGIDAKSLKTAAKQLAKNLAPLENRNIIYYEISSINILPLYAKDIKESTAHF